MLRSSGGYPVRKPVLARTHREGLGWPFVEPVHVATGLRSYHVTTNASAMGGNVQFRIRCRTGLVTSARLAAR